mmetsp:Transcript_100355/g.203407  ORF Transcript_100355/g.203407 Transcript_100355/m.203407 type:complete len:312 (+) Transcript_100355:58-993(+)
MRPIATPPRLKGTFHQAMMWPHRSLKWRRKVPSDPLGELDSMNFDQTSSRQGEPSCRETKLYSDDDFPEAHLTLWQLPTCAAANAGRKAIPVGRSSSKRLPPAIPCLRSTLAGEHARETRNISTVVEKTTYSHFIRRNIHEHIREAASPRRKKPHTAPPGSRPRDAHFDFIVATESFDRGVSKAQSLPGALTTQQRNAKPPSRGRPTSSGMDQSTGMGTVAVPTLKLPPPVTVVWQWEHRSGFRDYDLDVSTRIEQAYQRGNDYARTMSGKNMDIPMEIWFDEMYQLDPLSGNRRKVFRKVSKLPTRPGSS